MTTINIVKLKEIADVIAGYTFRSALENALDGNFFVLQAKNINLDGTVAEESLNKISFKNYRTVAGVKKEDVIISARGVFRAAVVKSDLENIIATSSVYILRVKSNNILPEYLTIYLNSPKTQQYISKKATGAAISTILKNDLANLPVSIPSWEKQKRAVNFFQTNQQLQKLLDQKKFLINKITETATNI